VRVAPSSLPSLLFTPFRDPPNLLLLLACAREEQMEIWRIFNIKEIVKIRIRSPKGRLPFCYPSLAQASSNSSSSSSPSLCPLSLRKRGRYCYSLALGSTAIYKYFRVVKDFISNPLDNIKQIFS
jgi:hypothetical protein